MRRWAMAGRAAYGALVFLACCPPVFAAAPCDQFDPRGPARSTRITLNSSDFTDEERDELRSFIATDSIGAVTAAIVAATPHGVARAVSAVPEVSRFSSHYGEELKGIAVAVHLVPGSRPVTVTVNLRQVCARYFRNTFLYY
jgi:hypothetical protein